MSHGTNDGVAVNKSRGRPATDACMQIDTTNVLNYIPFRHFSIINCFARIKSVTLKIQGEVAVFDIRRRLNKMNMEHNQ